MDDLIDDILLCLSMTAVANQRGERTFEAALARARAGGEFADGLEMLGLAADAEAFGFSVSLIRL
jgi:hypothetical protein